MDHPPTTESTHHQHQHWTQLVLGEVVAVVTCMRRNARWRDALLSTNQTAPPLHSGLHRPTTMAMTPDSLLPQQQQQHQAALASLDMDPTRSRVPLPSSAVTAVSQESSATSASMARPFHPALMAASVQEEQLHSPQLVQSFARLKQLLQVHRDIQEVDPMDILRPFIQVVLTAETTGPITAAALTSIEKLLSCGIMHDVHRAPVLYANTAVAIIHAATHCKFEATDAVSDEIVLMKILSVLKSVLEAPVGQLLSDESVCEIMETAFSMCFQMRLSELLRKYGEHVLVQMIHCIFTRILESEEPRSNTTLRRMHRRNQSSKNLFTEDSSRESTPIKETVIVDEFVHVPSTAQQIFPESENADGSTDEPVMSPAILASNMVMMTPPSKLQNSVPGNGSMAVNQTPSHSLAVHPFGLPAVKEIIRFVVSLLNPQDPHNTETMRLIALTVLQTIIETGASLIKDEDSLLKIMQSDGCRHLIMLIRTAIFNNNMLLMSAALRASVLLFQALDEDLWIQQEFFLNFLLSQLSTQLPAAVQVSSFSNEDELMRWVGKVRERMYQVMQKYGISWFLEESKAEPQLFEQTRESVPSLDALVASEILRVPIVKQKLSGYDLVSIEKREILMETLQQIIRNPMFFSQALIKSDCQMNNEDLVENMFLFLCRAVVLPNLIQDIQTRNWDSENQLGFGDEDAYGERYRDRELFNTTPYRAIANTSLDALHSCLGHLLERVQSYGYESSENGSMHDNVRAIFRNKLKKRQNTYLTTLFNSKSPKDLIAFAKSTKILPEDPSPSDTARFLHTLPSLNKRILGEFLSKPQNAPILNAYVDMLSWDDHVQIDEALRMMLEKFRLPGEAQQIQRVVEAFAGGYFESVVKKELEKFQQKPRVSPSPQPPPSTETDEKPRPVQFEEFPPMNPDAVFVLAYSIIMLNTDQHNPQVRRRMTAEDFIRNLRGTNDGKNFINNDLQEIFYRIKQREIIMPDEHSESDVGFEYSWRELVKKADDHHSPNDLQLNLFSEPWTLPDQKEPEICSSLISVDRELFKYSWKLIASTILYTFNVTETQQTLQKSIFVFYQMCSLAFYYGLNETLDTLLDAMLNATKLCNSATNTNPPFVDSWFSYDAKDEFDFYVQRSKFLQWLAKNFKCQVATLVVFKVLNEFGDGAQKCWAKIPRITSILHYYRLLSDPLSTGADLTLSGSNSALSRASIPNKKALSVSKPQESGSIFSALSSFLLSTTSPDRALEERLYEPDEKTIDSERACKEIVEELSLDRILLEKTLFYSTETLSNIIHAYISDANFSDFFSASVLLPQVTDRAVFTVEIISKILIWNVNRIELIWPYAEKTILSIAQEAVSLHHLLVKRTLTCVVQLIVALLVETSAFDPSTKAINSSKVHLRDSLLKTLSQFNNVLQETVKSKNSPESSTDFDPQTGLTVGTNLLSVYGECVMAGVSLIFSQVLQLSSNVFFVDDSDSGLAVVSAQKYLVQFLWPIFAPMISVAAMDVGVNSTTKRQKRNLPGKENKEKDVSLPKGGSKWAWDVVKTFCGALGLTASGRSQKLDISSSVFLEVVEIHVSFLNVAAAIIVQSNTDPVVISASSVAANLAKRERHYSTDSARLRTDLEPEKQDVQVVETVQSVVIFRALESLKQLHSFEEKIPHISRQDGATNLTVIDVWETYWLPVLGAISQQCYHPSREIRQHAITYLQRALLMPDLVAGAVGDVETCVIYSRIFSNILFPLLETLLKPEIAHLDHFVPIRGIEKGLATASSMNTIPGFQKGASIDEVRLRASALLCKIFLHYISKLAAMMQASELEELWARILDTLHLYWQNGMSMKSELKHPSVNTESSLVESVPESLKNMLLVMGTAGTFGQPSSFKGNINLWEITWKKVDPWLPQLRSDLYSPRSPERPPSKEALSTQENEKTQEHENSPVQ